MSLLRLSICQDQFLHFTDVYKCTRLQLVHLRQATSLKLVTMGVVKLRLARFGVRNNPFYRIVAIDSRKAREARPLEYVSGATSEHAHSLTQHFSSERLTPSHHDETELKKFVSRLIESSTGSQLEPNQAKLWAAFSPAQELCHHPPFGTPQRRALRKPTASKFSPQPTSLVSVKLVDRMRGDEEVLQQPLARECITLVHSSETDS